MIPSRLWVTDCRLFDLLATYWSPEQSNTMHEKSSFKWRFLHQKLQEQTKVPSFSYLNLELQVYQSCAEAELYKLIDWLIDMVWLSSVVCFLVKLWNGEMLEKFIFMKWTQEPILSPELTSIGSLPIQTLLEWHSVTLCWLFKECEQWTWCDCDCDCDNVISIGQFVQFLRSTSIFSR